MWKATGSAPAASLSDTGWGGCSVLAQKLMDVTEKALYEGIAQAVPGNRVTDISRAVQTYVESNGFSAGREFVGHGVGRLQRSGAEAHGCDREGALRRHCPGGSGEPGDGYFAGGSDVCGKQRVQRRPRVCRTRGGAAAAFWRRSSWM